MTAGLLVLAAAIWLVAAYAFVRALIAWLGVMSMAPQGAKLQTALDLGFWNFAAVERRVGSGATAHIRGYRSAFFLFFGAIIVFMAFVIVNIAVLDTGAQPAA